MRTCLKTKPRSGPGWTGLALILVLPWVAASCVFVPHRRDERPLHPGWPTGQPSWQETSFPALQVDHPEIADAEVIGENELCMTCHEGYTRHFMEGNVHRRQKCEDCHGAASEHLITRGQEPGLILTFSELTPPERSEICLKCHQRDACCQEDKWRTSIHAHNNVACTDCHTAHYAVPPGTPATSLDEEAALLPNDQSAGSQRAHGAETDTTSAAAGLENELIPVPSRAAIKMKDRSQTAGLIVIRAQGPQSDDSPVQDDSRPAPSNALGAVAPQVCYRCHQETIQLQEIADPHQIGGPNNFNCTTCHDPHGNLTPFSRGELCLKCHKGSPTKAWHSSIHAVEGVACTDCHNPHPETRPRRDPDIRHTNVRRPARLPMSVWEPDACYKCHPETFGKGSLPSHHPIQEGKMVCTDCHDPHGRFQANLRDVSVNQVCWRCHAETQGPFAYEHPPVTESCLICHEPHGTVENNLLRQPTTFLCLRCHSGHRTGPRFHDFPPGNPLLPDIGRNPSLQRAFFTDCTECHHQVHGSDVPSPHRSGVFAR